MSGLLLADSRDNVGVPATIGRIACDACTTWNKCGSTYDFWSSSGLARRLSLDWNLDDGVMHHRAILCSQR